MDYCGPRGIPYTEFLEWDDDSQDAAVAWVLHNRRTCDRCGTDTEEWFFYTPEGDKLLKDPPPYAAATNHCPGCATLDNESKRLPEGRETQYRLHLKRWEDLTLEEMPENLRSDDEPNEEPLEE